MLQEPTFSWAQSLILAKGTSPLIRPTQVSSEWGRWALLDSYCKNPASTQTADDPAASFSLHWPSCLNSCCVRRESNMEAEFLPFSGKFIHSTTNTAHRSLSRLYRDMGRAFASPLVNAGFIKPPNKACPLQHTLWHGKLCCNAPSLLAREMVTSAALPSMTKIPQI